MILKNKLIEKMEILFKILILCYTILSWNAITYGNRIISVVMWPTIILGIVLLGIRAKNYKNYIDNCAVNYLGILIVSFILSMILNLKYDMKNNCILLLFWFFYFFLLYPFDKSKKIEVIKKEFSIISIFFVCYMALGVLIALIMMIMHVSKVIEPASGNTIVIGFVWGRLWGVFLEPNVASVMSIIAFYLSLYWWKMCGNKILKCMYLLNAVQQILFIAFSDSRTGSVCLGISLGVYVFLNLKSVPRFEKKFRHTVIIFVVSVVVMISGVALPNWITNGYNALLSWESNEDEDVSGLKVERGYDVTEDYTNRRADIWRSGLEIFAKNPIYGTSYYGIRPYALEKMPDTYIVNNDFAELRNMHNEFVNILVSQGIIGAMILILIVFSYLRVLIKKWNLVEQKNRFLCVTLLVCILAMAGSTMLVSAGMFFYNAPSTIMFWCLLGYLMAIVDDKKFEEKNE